MQNKCTCWFDGWFGKSWKDCCELHDIDYMTVAGKHLTRKEADYKLFKCVRSRNCTLMATVMYIGVRLFGWFYWNKYKDTRNGNKL